MTIDYDQLRELVGEMEQGVAVTTRYTWLDLARELLRLRDEGENLRVQMLTHVARLRRLERHNIAYHVQQYAHRLARILDGDTE